MAAERASTRADRAVRLREQRSVRALTLAVDAANGDRPRRVPVALGNGALATASQLVAKQRQERLRSPRHGDDPVRDAGRLGADGDRRRTRRLGHEHERVAAGQPAEGAELIPDDKHEAGTDPLPPEERRDPAAGVGLVGQPDLDVLRVARHPSLREPDLDRGPACELGRLGERADPVGGEASLDRLQQLGDARLGGICPLRLRDQVDLAPVQPLRDDLRPEALRAEALHRQLRGSIERVLLGVGRHRREDPLGALLADPEHLGSPVEQQVQAARARRARP